MKDRVFPPPIGVDGTKLSKTKHGGNFQEAVGHSTLSFPKEQAGNRERREGQVTQLGHLLLELPAYLGRWPLSGGEGLIC